MISYMGLPYSMAPDKILLPLFFESKIKREEKRMVFLLCWPRKRIEDEEYEKQEEEKENVIWNYSVAIYLVAMK